TFETQTVRAVSQAPTRGLKVSADPRYLDAAVQQIKGRFEIQLTPRPSLPAGQFQTVVVVTAVGEGGKTLPPAKLAVEGRVVETIQCSPPTVLAGVHKVGERCSKVVTLQSIDGTPFTVTGFKLPAEGNVAVEPVAGGDRPGVARFRLNVSVPGKGNQQQK